MRSEVKVGAWALIDDDCPMDCSINGEHDIDLMIGDGFEMTFTVEALGRFVELAGTAIGAAREQAEEYARRQGAGPRAGG